MGSVCASDKAALKAETHAFSVQLQDSTTLFLPTFWELAQCVALILTLWASTLSALRLAIELLHVRPRLFLAARGHNFAPIFALSLDRKNFLVDRKRRS